MEVADFAKIVVNLVICAILLIALAEMNSNLKEIRDAQYSNNATLGEICARLDSLTITLPEGANIHYFAPRKEK